MVGVGEINSGSDNDNDSDNNNNESGSGNNDVNVNTSTVAMDIDTNNNNGSGSSSSGSSSGSNNNNSVVSSSGTSSEGGVGGDVSTEYRVDSPYYSILDSLVTACDLPKLSDAIQQYNNRFSPSLTHTSTGTGSSSSSSSELRGRLLESLCPTEIVPKSNSVSESVSESERVRERVTVSDILIATNDLLEALTVLNLTESYKMIPLMTGDRMKQVLKNIPKGTMFGEVRVRVRKSNLIYDYLFFDY